jgi:hypothetical protein
VGEGIIKLTSIVTLDDFNGVPKLRGNKGCYMRRHHIDLLVGKDIVKEM